MNEIFKTLRDKFPFLSLIRKGDMEFVGIVQTGGEAKLIIRSGKVSVNGMVETRRGKKLTKGDQDSYGSDEFIVGES